MSPPDPQPDLSAPFVFGRHYPATPLTGMPLDRFLPPYYEGMAADWAAEYASPGDWILDPFGQDPFSAIELAERGFRVLVTCNNPVPAFIMQVLASAPSAEAWGDALLAFANLKNSHGIRLEDEISAYYQLPCPNPDCPNGQFEVSYFIWHEGESHPSLAAGLCPQCQYTGEISLTEEVLAQLARLPSFALHKAQAMEATAPINSALRPVMEEVIGYYSPRPLIMLQTAINRLAQSDLSAHEKTLIQALLLTTADQINQLWAYPLGRNRPRQLVRPPVFQENNFWQAMLHSKSQWQKLSRPVSLTLWPAQPPKKGGIALFRGRLRELSPRPEAGLIRLVHTSLPRRNQAFWNLSGLWAGWLWGQDSLSPMRNSLLKQRYDWTWHTTALRKVLSQLPQFTAPETPVLLQVGEMDALFVSASALAAQNAGLTLAAYAADSEPAVLQTVWRQTASGAHPATLSPIGTHAKTSAVRHLTRRAEPADFLGLYSAVFLDLISHGDLWGQPESQPTGTLNELVSEIENALNDPHLFTRFNPGASLETGQYWLADPSGNLFPLADQLEETVLNAFHQQPSLTERQIVAEAGRVCRGMLTADPALLAAVLESYATCHESSAGEKLWVLNPREAQSARLNEREAIAYLIRKMGAQLGYLVLEDQGGLLWKYSENDQVAYCFHIITTAMIASEMNSALASAETRLIVIPGSRSNLVTFKLKRDEHLRELLAEGCQLVKYRQIRNLSNNPLLSRELFASQISSDPPEYHSSQLALF